MPSIVPPDPTAEYADDHLTFGVDTEPGIVRVRFADAGLGTLAKLSPLGASRLAALLEAGVTKAITGGMS